jgi:hypothetical protein
MAKNQRCVLPGQAHHITQRGTHRQRLFFKDADRSTYLRLMAHNLADAGIRVPAWNRGRVSGFSRSPVWDYFDGAAGVADGGPLHSAFFRFQPPPNAW